MSSEITILLLEDVAALGKAGDIVSVSEDYARQTLFPEGKAALAKQAMPKQSAAPSHDFTKLQAKAEQLEGTELTLIGSASAQQIADELNRAAVLSLQAKDVDLKKPFEVGSQDVVVQLSPDIEINIRVTVIPNEET